MKKPNYEKYGLPNFPIKGSRYYRQYCPECFNPLRVDKSIIELSRIGLVDFSDYCVDCNPPHEGCSSPPSPLDEIDEYSSSWKLGAS